MMKTAKTKIFAVGCVAIITCILGIYSLLYWRIRTMRVWNGPVLEKTAEAITENLKEATKQVPPGSAPWRKVDHNSIGFPSSEAELLELEGFVGVFEVSQRSLPAHSADLLALERVAPRPPRVQARLNKLVKDCQLISLAEDSYILNCDGWTPPSGEALKPLVNAFDSETERFYNLQGHVILYVPPFVKARPFSEP